MKNEKNYANFLVDGGDGKENQAFYHGTSDALQIEDMILPAAFTGRLREEWRMKLVDKVFLTNSVRSAKQYAKKAAAKFGGEPIVYLVKPIGELWELGQSEFVADAAEIVSVLGK